MAAGKREGVRGNSGKREKGYGGERKEDGLIAAPSDISGKQQKQTKEIRGWRMFLRRSPRGMMKKSAVFRKIITLLIIPFLGNDCLLSSRLACLWRMNSKLENFPPGQMGKLQVGIDGEKEDGKVGKSLVSLLVYGKAN